MGALERSVSARQTANPAVAPPRSERRAPGTCRGPWFRRMALCLALASSGCTEASAHPTLNEVLIALGARDEPVPTPVEVTVLADLSIGSSATRDRLRRDIGIILRHVSIRPGSRVRLAVLGADPAATAVVGEQVVPALRRGSSKSHDRATAKFVETAGEYFDAVAAPAYEAPSAKKSPLFESVTKLSLSDGGGLPRTLVVVTDAREYSPVADFECRQLPKNDAFTAKLRALHLLAPGSLAGIDVQFVDVEMRPIPGRGCPVDVARQLRIRELWSLALKGAGAASVRITDGPVAFATNHEGESE